MNKKITVALIEVDNFERELYKTERKLKKLGVTLNIEKELVSQRILVKKNWYSIACFEFNISLNSDIGIFDDYKYICSIDRTNGDNYVNYFSEDEKDLSKYYNAEIRCDHCKTNRYRTKAHIFEKNGKEIMIANSCAELYFGSRNGKMLHKLVKAFSIFANKYSNMNYNEGNSFGFGGFSGTIEEIEEYCKKAYFVISDSKEFISKSKAEEKTIAPTSSIVNALFVSIKVEMENFEKLTENFNFKDIVDYWIEKQMKVNSVFNHNVNVCLSGGKFSDGILAFAVFEYIKENTEILEKKIKIVKKNEFVGKIGDTIETEVYIEKDTTIPSQYYNGNDSSLYRMRDLEGRTLCAFTSSTKIYKVFDPALENKTSVRIVGIVKSHSTYQNWKQTTLSRIKIVKGS